MGYRLLTILLFLLIHCLSSTAQDDIALVKQNIREWFATQKADATEIDSLLTGLDENGAWDDIDYTIKQRGDWPVMYHLDRLLSLSIAFVTNDTLLSDSLGNKKKILAAYDYFVTNNFTNTNWWNNVIGIQRSLGPITILLEDHLSNSVVKKGMEILKRPEIGKTGQNKVWLAGNVIYRAVMQSDTALLRASSNAIKEEITVTDGEGIQADYSFHQHGPQQQFGNYGLHYAEQMIFWGAVLDSTRYAFSETQKGILRHFLFDGLRWVSMYNQFDISACGRQLFPDEQLRKDRLFQRILEDFSALDEKSQLRSTVSEGNKYFWNSDYMLHHQERFASSIKMSSTRVLGAEAGNDENMLGYHLGDGAMYIYRNGKEYLNIFPFWDWRKIPGTTTRQDTLPLPVLNWSGYHNQSDFVGACSNKRIGIAAMNYNRDSLNALKSWFMFEDAVVCVGSGIQSKRMGPVVTSINQCYLSGKVIVADNEYIRALGKGEHFFENLQWVVHDSIGYYFFYNQQVVIEKNAGSGNWKKVVAYLPEVSMEEELFSMTIEHGDAPEGGTYAYCVVPGVDRSTMESYYRYQLLENTDAVHAVMDGKKERYGIVFFKERGLMLSKNLGVGVNHPAIVMLEVNSEGLVLNLSDPSCLQDALEVTIIGNYSSSDTKFSNDLKNGETTFFVDLPDGKRAGSSVEIFIKRSQLHHP